MNKMTEMYLGFQTLPAMIDEYGALKNELDAIMAPFKSEQKRLAKLKEVLPDYLKNCDPADIGYGHIWMVECKRTVYNLLDSKRIQAEMTPEFLAMFQKPVERCELRAKQL